MIKTLKKVAIKTNKIECAFNTFQKLQYSNEPKFQKLDEWLEKESNIFENELKKHTKMFPKFKRGGIVKIDFGINLGSELSHTHFAIVLNSDDTNYNDNITVLPITSKNGYKRIPLGKILKKAMPTTQKYKLECFGFLTQITTISKRRVYNTKNKYICDDNILNEIDKSVIRFLTKSK